MHRPVLTTMTRQRSSTVRPMNNSRHLPSLAMGSPASRNGPRGAKPSSGRCDTISSPCLSVLECCPASILLRRGARGNMAFPASGPLASSRSLPANLAIISNFGVSVFSTKPMRLNSDGVGCGGEDGGRSPTRSQAHSPIRPAAVPQARLRNFNWNPNTELKPLQFECFGRVHNL